MGHGVSEEARKAMSIGHIGRKASDDTKKKMSILRTGIPMGPMLEERKIKIRDKINEYYAKDPSNRMKVVYIASEETRRKFSILASKRKNMLGKHHSQETKDKISRSKVGKSNGIIYTDEIRNKMSTSRKNLMKTPEFMKIIAGGGKFISKPEDEFSIILDNMRISYERQYPITNICHGYPCDFFLEKWNMIIEIDGLYWHNYPHGKDIDHIRNKELKNAGYHIIRFWENDIERPDYIEDEITNFIKNIDCSFGVAL